MDKPLTQAIRKPHTRRTLARNMAWFLKCKDAAEAAGVTTPVQEPWTPTNFIR